MEAGEKKTLIIVGVLVVLGVVLVFALQRGVIGGGVLGLEGEDAAPGSLGLPDANEPLTEAQAVTAAAPGVEAQLRAFDFTASQSGFEPEKIVVNEGDTVSLHLKAGESEFDIVIPAFGLRQTASPDDEEQRTLEFQATTAGTYPFMCEDACPGGRKLEGLLMVKKVGE